MYEVENPPKGTDAHGNPPVPTEGRIRRGSGPVRFQCLQHIGFATFLAVVTLFAGCSDDDDDGTTAPTVSPQLEIENQIVDPANEVVVHEVEMLEDGWVAIHEDESDEPGAVIGTVAVPVGTTLDVTVELEREAVDGEEFIGMIHLDRGVPDVFEYPGPDVPAVNSRGEFVTDPFSVTVLPPPEPSLAVDDQTLSDLSTAVIVSQVVSSGSGWVVIHANVEGEPGEGEPGEGEPGPVRGYAHVESATTADVRVILDRPAEDQETFHAMLHVDEGEAGVYEFPGEDVPAVNAEDEIVVSAFTVTVPVDVPAVRLHLTNVGINAYELGDVEPESYRDSVGSSEENPTLMLQAGWRYEIENDAAAVHPLELVTLGSVAGDDVILLSQESAGTLEEESTIDWVADPGATNMRFTVSPVLAAALTGYRCYYHQETMRGSILVD